MLDQPEVSVVLPTKDRAYCLMRSITSVLWQTFADFELVVVDDGSTDDTMDLLASLRDPRVRVVRHGKTLGTSAARNTGIAEARARLVAFQDSDDIWLPHKLERQLPLIGADDTEPSVVWCGKLQLFSNGPRLVPARSYRCREGVMIPGLLQGPSPGTPTFLVQRRALEEVDGFDESLTAFEDWDLAIRLAEAHRFAFVDEVLVIASKSADSLSIDPSRLLKTWMALMSKHDALFRSHANFTGKNFYSLGHLAMDCGDVQHARAFFMQALRRSPGSVRYVLALLLSILGRSFFLRAHARYAQR
jgi:glycosyltransferase involved in cell wall biosynthesis